MEWDEMTLEELYALREKILADIAELDGKMPFDEGSEAFEAWADEHEELEDVLDDVVERIEELGGTLG